MMVKICGITNAEDAGVAAEAGASAIGFIFYPPSPRYIEPERAAAIARGMNVLKVGVFVEEPAIAIEGVAREVGLDVVQVYGSTGPVSLPVWRAFRIDATFDRTLIASAASDAILLDGTAAGRTFPWELAAGLPARVILAGGLDASNVREAIRVARPWGVDASSRLESAPGRKDHVKVRQFVEAALSERI